MLLISSAADVNDGGLWQETEWDWEFHLPVAKINEKTYIILTHCMDDPQSPQEHYCDLSVKEGACTVCLVKGGWGWTSAQGVFNWFEEQFSRIVELDRILSASKFEEE